jgi:hypothetical protein
MIHSSRRSRIRACLVSLLAAAVAIPALNGGAARAASPDAVDKAIAKAQQYLISAQHGDNWETSPTRKPGAESNDTNSCQWGGLTSIATYALLASGVKSDDAHVSSAVNFLLKSIQNAGIGSAANADLIGIYAIGLRCQVWESLPHDQPNKGNERAVIAAMGHDLALLRAGREPQAAPVASKLLWDYTITPPGARYDHSCSQYGVLGFWAAAQMNFEISDAEWRSIQDAYFKQQCPDGGFDYDNVGPAHLKSTATMTAAGIASMFIAQDYLNVTPQCNGNFSSPNLEHALDWFGKNFNTVFQNAANNYGLYGVERIGVASGYKYFGTNDWYQRGADFFLQTQQPDGSWNGFGGPVANTAFGLLFLSRGRGGVIANKLRYSFPARGTRVLDAHWNERPRDAAHWAAFLSKYTEHPINWQVVSLENSVEDMHDAPYLYIAGNQPLNLSPADEQRLKTFINEGGILLFNADCGNYAFTQSLRKLAKNLYPDYEWKPIGMTDRLMTSPVKIKRRSDMMTLSNGARNLMIAFGSSDPARYLQSGALGGHEWQTDMLVNLYAYGTDIPEEYVKTEPYWVGGGQPAAAGANAIKIARLQYIDGQNAWNPEPGGWVRLANIMASANPIDVEPVELGKGKLNGQGFRIAHMTGCYKFHLNDAQGKELRDFVNGGGTLVVDACGGQGEFAASAEAELGKLFPANQTQLDHALPIDNPVFNVGGKQVEIAYRRYARPLIIGANKPHLRAMTINNRAAVYYSPEDLSVGLVGQQVDGILGYTPPVATQIMENIILTAANGPAPAGAPPASPGASPSGAPNTPAAGTGPNGPPAAAPAHRPGEITIDTLKQILAAMHLPADEQAKVDALTTKLDTDSTQVQRSVATGAMTQAQARTAQVDAGNRFNSGLQSILTPAQLNDFSTRLQAAMKGAAPPAGK